MSRINPAITKLLNEAEEMTPNKQQIIDEAIAFFEDQNFGVDVYEESEYGVCGLEFETWTNCDVDMLIFIDGRDEDMEDPDWWKRAFRQWVECFDIDEEIDLHREDPTYKSHFKIRESIQDFEEFLEKMEKIADALCNVKF